MVFNGIKNLCLHTMNLPLGFVYNISKNITLQYRLSSKMLRYQNHSNVKKLYKTNNFNSHFLNSFLQFTAAYIFDFTCLALN